MVYFQGVLNTVITNSIRIHQYLQNPRVGSNCLGLHLIYKILVIVLDNLALFYLLFMCFRV